MGGSELGALGFPSIRFRLWRSKRVVIFVGAKQKRWKVEQVESSCNGSELVEVWYREGRAGGRSWGWPEVLFRN
jgi:hypothetical protein